MRSSKAFVQGKGKHLQDQQGNTYWPNSRIVSRGEEACHTYDKNTDVMISIIKLYTTSMVVEGSKKEGNNCADALSFVGRISLPR